MRLDGMLLEKGYYRSRNKASEAIRRGKVKVDGNVTLKPSAKVSGNESIVIAQERFYVSRSAEKLKSYFEEYTPDIEGKIALDIGSSTGGFTQVLLEYGAAGIDAVDVGHGQLAEEILNDERVNSYERTDIRDFEPTRRYSVVVSDVSFISLLHILPAIERVSRPGADIILLFKPQFEVGPDVSRDSRGVVRDERAIEEAMSRFESSVKDIGWIFLRKESSRIQGKHGNQEYIYHFIKRDPDNG